MNNIELQQQLEVSLSMQRSLASDLNQAQAEMEQVRIAIGSLGWMTLGEAITLTMSEKDKQIAELQRKVDVLAVENARLNPSAGLFFSYGSEHGFDFHKSAKEAIEAAEGAIDDYRGDACDGWSEETDSICWGVIMQSSTKVGERPRTEDDRCDPSIDTICDYALLPSIETPATDAALAEIRAQGADAVELYHKERFDHFNSSGLKDAANRHGESMLCASDVARQLRRETGQ